MTRIDSIKADLITLGVPMGKATLLAVKLDNQLGLVFGTGETTQNFKMLDGCLTMEITAKVVVQNAVKTSLRKRKVLR